MTKFTSIECERDSDFDPIPSSLRIVIFTNNGATKYSFYLYRRAFCKYLFSACGRVRVYYVTAPDPTEPGSIVRVPNQYRVTVNGKRCPECQYTVLHSVKRERAKKTFSRV